MKTMTSDCKLFGNCLNHFNQIQVLSIRSENLLLVPEPVAANIASNKENALSDKIVDIEASSPQLAFDISAL